MHDSSLHNMKNFFYNYFNNRKEEELKILDVGSFDMNGSYKHIIEAFNEFNKWFYTGLDIVEGENVDIVVSDHYNWDEIKNNTYDIVICGQTLEHVEYFWLTMKEIARVMKKDGYCCIIVPSTGPEHRYPLDCWRFLSDGLRALAKYADLDIIENYIHTEPHPYPDTSYYWKDGVLICKKRK